MMNVAHDPECLARTQHLLYRRDPERFAPSPAFTKAWDRYVTMHRACSQGKNWTHVFLHERNNKANDCNYLIVMKGVGGLGNKLLSLTSAFAYGLVTDRVVLVEGRD
jgi:xyloglucan fucosyltransferase